MAARRQNYEMQAKLSVALGALGGLSTLAGAVFILQAFNATDFQVVYNPASLRIVAIGGALFVALAASAAGFLLGLLSAGQRSNPRGRLAWTGFFLNAAVIALALSCGLFFYLTRFAVDLKRAAAAGG